MLVYHVYCDFTVRQDFATQLFLIKTVFESSSSLGMLLKSFLSIFP